MVITFNAKKTKYASARTPGGKNRPLRIRMYDRKSEAGGPQRIFTKVIKCLEADAPLRYLGGYVSCTLRQRLLYSAIRPKIQNDLGKLARKRLSLEGARTFYQMVTMGRAGYYLPLAQIPTSWLDHWDKSIRMSFRSKAGLPYTAGIEVATATAPAGMSVPTFTTLSVSAGVAELLTRLTSPGLMGDIARLRWRRMRLKFLR